MSWRYGGALESAPCLPKHTRTARRSYDRDGERLVRTTVHLTEKEHDFLREKSYRERRSVSEILREVLREQFPELDGEDE